MVVAFVHVSAKGEYARWGDTLAQTMVASVKRVMPHTPIIQLADMTTTPIRGITDKCVIEPDDDYLMTFRLKAMASMTGNVIFLDTDVLLTEPIQGVFDSEFDVAMVHRGHQRIAMDTIVPPMPYNTGFIASRTPTFFQRCYSACRAFPDKYKEWFGDQLAVAQVAPDYNVRLLADEWNHAPRNPDDLDAKVLHYKGAKRKGWMLPAWEALRKKPAGGSLCAVKVNAH